jgi:chlorite dismutase
MTRNDGRGPETQKDDATDVPKLDLRERGRDRTGQPEFFDRRLFMQFTAFDCRADVDSREGGALLVEAIATTNLGAVVYEDVNHARGFGVLAFSETALDFVERLRPALGSARLAPLVPRREYAWLGRTYSSGFETDLEYWLLRRPRETVLNEAWPWAIWYPLRRSGAFERLALEEKAAILREHAAIGRSYGESDLAHDVRLACHGLDASDNEFLVGLVGRALYPLSHVVESMRSTRQTSQYITQMGPFFVGRALHRQAPELSR